MNVHRYVYTYNLGEMNSEYFRNVDIGNREIEERKREEEGEIYSANRLSIKCFFFFNFFFYYNNGTLRCSVANNRVIF